jgi:hypothetical protein
LIKVENTVDLFVFEAMLLLLVGGIYLDKKQKKQL